MAPPFHVPQQEPHIQPLALLAPGHNAITALSRFYGDMVAELASENERLRKQVRSFEELCSALQTRIGELQHKLDERPNTSVG